MTAQELKNSILQLAVEGKLVPHTNENASKLLEKIKTEKVKLIAEGKISGLSSRAKSRDLPPITEDEKPFDIPENWCWCRLGELGFYKKGPFGSALIKDIFIPKSETAIKVYEQKNAIKKDITLGNYYIKREYFESNMKGFEVHSGDILVSCAGTIGETFVVPDNHEKGIINQALMKISLVPCFYKEFFLVYFDYVLKKSARESSKGSAIKNIPPFDILKNYLFPLPPLSEQKAIVAKIEELLPYIEKYDAAYTKLRSFNKKFPQDMQKSILQQAVQGKLIIDNGELKIEETGAQLLERIRAEKQKLIAEGKIKKEKDLPPITEDEIPFDIPENWCWCRLGEIAETNIGLTYSPSNISEKGIGVLRSNNIQDGKIIYDDIVRVNIEVPENKMCIPGDILICARNGSKRLVGKAALIKDTGFSFGAFMAILRSVCNEYLLYVINSAYFRNYLLPETGTTTINQITQDSLKKVLIPLPPLAEQKRIVAKIEELLPLCKKLERQDLI